jgi:hypothetical protein
LTIFVYLFKIKYYFFIGDLYVYLKKIKLFFEDICIFIWGNKNFFLYLFMKIKFFLLIFFILIYENKIFFINFFYTYL